MLADRASAPPARRARTGSDLMRPIVPTATAATTTAAITTTASASPPGAKTAAGTAAAAAPSAALPDALDWRTYRGGGWLSALPPRPPQCSACSGRLVTIAMGEARVRIASNRSQSDALSLADALGCVRREDSNATPVA